MIKSYQFGRKAAVVVTLYGIALVAVASGVLVALLSGKDGVVLWPLVLGVPLGWPLLWAPIDNGLVLWACFLALGVVQGWLIWRLCRGPRSRPEGSQ
ncbi:hypothetical protein [Microtetraspora fusca]|uniref:Uncharacterized protein n=1 Tax=Microtetraspora fusca TaxID=1997 RepID=A0ABW6UY90_MICFU|nr:hypothetical protein [Microtetraspora fusca]